MRESQTAVYGKGQVPMTEELVALLRNRVAGRFYDQPQVIDIVARAVLREVNGLRGD